MACCGQKRAQLNTQGTMAPSALAPTVSRFALYEYTGEHAMTIVAPNSGSRYRFTSAGAKVQVDLRDVASMAALPHLKRIA